MCALNVFLGIPRLFEDEHIHVRCISIQAYDGEFKGMSCRANNDIDNNGSI